ncbi:hypothetical protein [Mucilaginibacter sp.]|jgi:hypothetical protein|uniref:hypothetical protein n=1 Tax=Mucilaginibacter sp. TaxID=1882438 RepID=UPI002CA3E2F6|nr:hypothetical protein [Mucilaginibacter sp.]HTI60125.1 hypothetical protein [Mucilaginibacter sp.]
MFTLFHFGFEIFKIAIQAAVYALTILTLKFVLTEIIKNDSLRLIKFKPVYLSVSALMLVFSFTYYGDHGLGDEANIPLGHWKSMNSTDGNPYFALKPDSEVNVDSFLVRNEHLCFVSDNNYYDYHLISGEWNKHNSKQEYETYASVHHLPQVSEFKTFYQRYAVYWNGWRFWFLP